MIFPLTFAHFFFLDPYAGRYTNSYPMAAFAMVDGFFAGCTPLEPLLPSTLDCLYDSQCLLLLRDYFPSLNQVSSIPGLLIFMYAVFFSRRI